MPLKPRCLLGFGWRKMSPPFTDRFLSRLEGNAAYRHVLEVTVEGWQGVTQGGAKGVTRKGVPQVCQAIVPDGTAK